ncbi:PAS domain-containing protein [Methanoregula sp.]|uniref:PAS domain-containing protein n=1 Tax=Methanoregula sp. TaxID=2052170 RepID=UPI002CD58490|nr:PAS domain-containing protein [Methanoregula sp.]HVP97326.1 PAS domain-containing protein [Methanoregula sp.]
MGSQTLEREVVLRLFIIAFASVVAILGTVFSLMHGISVVFPFLYILPIICVVYFSPKRAVLFTLGISIVYIGLVYLLGGFNPALIAISTAWFAIFITLAVVASSYANGILEEKSRIRHIMENTLEGIFCFDPGSWKIREVNQKCAQWLLYSRTDLKGAPVSTVWTDTAAHHRFMNEVKAGNTGVAFDALFRGKNGGVIRVVVSPLYVTKEMVLCSVVNMTDARVADEEIRQTLEDLERQVRERTAHLERINDELRTEILERRRLEQTLLSGPIEDTPKRDEEEEP